VVLVCTCGIVCMLYMSYYVCAFCSHGIMTCAFVVLYYVYVCVLFCTPYVRVCIVLCCTLDVGECVVMYIRRRCMHYVAPYVVCGCMCCDVQCVYVYMIEEKKKALGVATDLMCIQKG